MSIPNKVQLITYADSMGGDLQALRRVLNTHFAGDFPVLHILPPFPSSGDRGFAPIDYFQIEPQFGSWADMDALGQEHGLLVDLMVNHISKASPEFQDYLRRGAASPYANYFLPLGKIWPGGEPVPQDLEKIYLRRERPWSCYTLGDGTTARIWTTFGMTEPSEQIDLDVNEPAVRQMFQDIFTHFARHGIRLVRLDAVGYAIKKAGTSCFLVEPDIYDFMDWAKAAAGQEGIELLCEVHAETGVQYRLARHGYWIYDFLLPYTVLHLLHHKNSGLLYRMLEGRPENQFTTLDCHDGVPVKPDLDGWVEADQAREVCEACKMRGAHFTRVVSEEHKGTDGFDVHQICGSYYSLLGKNDDAYIAARAIQFFVPGIPQLYYVGLLAGVHDEARRKATGDDREANRHNFTEEEVAAACEKQVVQRLLVLIRLRNSHPAFGGVFTALPAGESEVVLQWQAGEDFCRLHIDLNGLQSEVDSQCNGKQERFCL